MCDRAGMEPSIIFIRYAAEEIGNDVVEASEAITVGANSALRLARGSA